jgi:hypothetical protein
MLISVKMVVIYQDMFRPISITVSLPITVAFIKPCGDDGYTITSYGTSNRKIAGNLVLEDLKAYFPYFSCKRFIIGIVLNRKYSCMSSSRIK